MESGLGRKGGQDTKTLNLWNFPANRLVILAIQHTNPIIHFQLAQLQSRIRTKRCPMKTPIHSFLTYQNEWNFWSAAGLPALLLMQ